MAVKRQFPDPHWHRGHANFASSPRMPKKEYEKSPKKDLDTDEPIAIFASSNTDLIGFAQRRSILSRSPIFADFFASVHYLPGVDMALWFFSEHAVVIYLVLRYLLHGNEFRTPSFGLFCVSDQIYIQIRLYFLAKYLQLPDLEDIAFDMLLLSEGSFAPPDVIDLARLSYGEACKKDTRIRTFLARRVERNLRALLCIPAWGKLLRSASSSLAADMFELVSVVQLQGEAGGYPIRLPLVAPTVPTVTGPWQELCAVAVRNFYPSACGEILLLRGEKLHDCRIIGNSVFGVNNNGVRGRVERDFVELILEVEQEEESDTTELNDDDDDDSSEEAVPYDVDEILGADDDVDDTDEELYNLELSKVKKHQSPQTRDKASWILGLDYVMDVFADSPTPRSSTSTSVLMDKKTNGSRRFRLKT